MIYALLALISVLWWVGGGKQAWARDILIPVILGLFFAFKCHWWAFFAVGGLANIIHLGYGNYSPQDDSKASLLAMFIKDRQGAIIRAVYGLICALLIGAILLYQRHILGYLVYIVLNTLIGYGVSKLRLPRLFADLLVGLGIGSVILL